MREHATRRAKEARTYQEFREWAEAASGPSTPYEEGCRERYHRLSREWYDRQVLNQNQETRDLKE
jgi:hypothetical protein